MKELIKEGIEAYRYRGLINQNKLEGGIRLLLASLEQILVSFGLLLVGLERILVMHLEFNEEFVVFTSQLQDTCTN
ncbi:hypothetical protein ACIQWI_24100 [Peribacillus frigoritolerans]